LGPRRQRAENSSRWGGWSSTGEGGGGAGVKKYWRGGGKNPYHLKNPTPPPQRGITLPTPASLPLPRTATPPPPPSTRRATMARATQRRFPAGASRRAWKDDHLAAVGSRTSRPRTGAWEQPAQHRSSVGGRLRALVTVASRQPGPRNGCVQPGSHVTRRIGPFRHRARPPGTTHLVKPCVAATAVGFLRWAAGIFPAHVRTNACRSQTHATGIWTPRAGPGGILCADEPRDGRRSRRLRRSGHMAHLLVYFPREARHHVRPWVLDEQHDDEDIEEVGKLALRADSFRKRVGATASLARYQ